MAGTKISDATLRSTLKGTESIPLVDTDLPTGRTTAANLKTYCAPDLSQYATKTEVQAKLDTDTYNSDKANFATKTELSTKLNTSTYNSDKESFATKTDLSTYVSGTGVTKMQVVTELPESPDASTLYIVTTAEETA